jgi:hypothetical protein
LRSGKSATRLRDMRKGRYLSNKGLRKRIVHLLGRPVKPAKARTEETQAAAE